jgi:hypothetical protein
MMAIYEAAKTGKTLSLAREQTNIRRILDHMII